MRRLQEWILSRKEVLTFLGTIIFSLTLIFSNKNATQLQTVKVWTIGGVGVLLDKMSAVGALFSVYEENRWLRKRNTELMLQNSQLKEAEYENERLHNMLEFSDESALELTPARVIGKRHDAFVNSIVLSVGASDGLSKNMPVVISQGLVGKLYEVGKDYSISQLLLDRNFKVSAMIQRSRVTGIVNWNQGNSVSLTSVPRRSDVVAGDTVITSGYSSIFPKGLKIGIVTETRQDMRDLFMNIVVKPEVDFAKLEEVFVIRDKQEIPMVTQ